MSVGLAQNGGSVVLTVGQRLLLVLPRPNGRELGDEIVQSSNESVLELQVTGAGAPAADLEEPFRAIQPGTSLVTVSGELGYRLLVEVQAT